MFGPCDSCLGRKKQHILACCNNWSHAIEWFYVGVQQTLETKFTQGLVAGGMRWYSFDSCLSAPSCRRQFWRNYCRISWNHVGDIRRHNDNNQQRDIFMSSTGETQGGSLQEPNQADWLLLREGWANCKNPFTKFLVAVGKRWYSLAFPPLSVKVTIWRDDSRINSNHVGGTLTSKETCFSSSVMGRTNQYILVLHSKTNHPIKWHLVSARHTLASNPFTNKLADGWSSKAMTSFRFSASVSQWNNLKRW